MWKNLESLQELDLQIGQIIKKKSEFPAKISTYESEIKKLSLQVDEKNKILSEMERNRKQQLGAIELNEERSKRSQEKMALIKNSTELSALQREVESLKKNSDIIKENATKSEAEINKVMNEVSEIQKSIAEITAIKDQEVSKIQSEDKDLSSGLGTLESRRKETAAFVDGKILTLYDRVRGARAGVGIAITTDGRCNGCNIKLPPQTFNELQKKMNEIMQCPTCKRILIYKSVNKS